MAQKVVIATGNAGKMHEFRAILGDSVFFFFSSKEVGFLREIEENAKTFRGNAELKARIIWEHISLNYNDCWVLADDSGLEVEALGGRPGVFSARYAGEGATNVERYTKLLKEMEGASNRGARFFCSLCLIRPGNEPEFFDGECRGSILPAPKGLGGFGYDPVFLPEGYSIGFGEMGEEEKNALSHRGKAIKNMMAHLEARALV